MLQIHASSHENRFQVSSSVTPEKHYDVTLEAGDWGYGDHKCSCPDAQNHPGRWCKHIRAVIQRIQSVLPQAIKGTDYERYDLDAVDFVYRPDPASHAQQIDATNIFYAILHQAQTFTVISEPASVEQIIRRTISGYRGESLRLIFDVEAMCWYIKNRAETLAFIDAYYMADVSAMIEGSTWFIGEKLPETNYRYTEYALTHHDPGARSKAIAAQYTHQRKQPCTVNGRVPSHA